MTEAIKVTIKYEKYTTSAEPTDLESFTLAFMVDPDATYHVILEKIEIMLKSMGYETPSRLDFISDYVESDNVVQLRPVLNDKEQ